LPLIFAQIKAATGAPQMVFIAVALVALVCLVWLHVSVLNIRIRQLESQLAKQGGIKV
jgi:nitrate/nitrite transporter NarK